jgi:cell filamentation protein
MEENIERYYKAFNFDLDQSKLDEFYKKHNTKAYYEIENFFKKNNISHRQGSGYLSNQKLTVTQTENLLTEMFVELNWLIDVAKKVDVTNVGNSFDFLNNIKNNRIAINIINQSKIVTKKNDKET